MVKALREGGFLPAPRAGSPTRRLVVTLLLGVGLGAMIYLLGVFAVPQLPHLLRLLQKAPPPVEYVKPAG